MVELEGGSIVDQTRCWSNAIDEDENDINTDTYKWWLLWRVLDFESGALFNLWDIQMELVSFLLIRRSEWKVTAAAK